LLAHVGKFKQLCVESLAYSTVIHVCIPNAFM
jgi:hypothetical protein